MKRARGGLTPAGLGFSIAVLLLVVGGALAGSYPMAFLKVEPVAAPAASSAKEADAPPAKPTSPRDPVTLASDPADARAPLKDDGSGGAADANETEAGDEETGQDRPGDGSDDPDGPPDAPPGPQPPDEDPPLLAPVEKVIQEALDAHLSSPPSLPPLGTGVVGLR